MLCRAFPWEVEQTHRTKNEGKNDETFSYMTLRKYLYIIYLHFLVLKLIYWNKYYLFCYYDYFSKDRDCLRGNKLANHRKHRFQCRRTRQCQLPVLLLGAVPRTQFHIMNP